MRKVIYYLKSQYLDERAKVHIESRLKEVYNTQEAIIMLNETFEKSIIHVLENDKLVYTSEDIL